MSVESIPRYVERQNVPTVPRPWHMSLPVCLALSLCVAIAFGLLCYWLIGVQPTLSISITVVTLFSLVYLWSHSRRMMVRSPAGEQWIRNDRELNASLRIACSIAQDQLPAEIEECSAHPLRTVRPFRYKTTIQLSGKPYEISFTEHEADCQPSEDGNEYVILHDANYVADDEHPSVDLTGSNDPSIPKADRYVFDSGRRATLISPKFNK